MEVRLDNLLANDSSSKNFMKADKALDDYFKKKNVRREMDIIEIYLGNKDLKELRSFNRYKNLSRLWLHSNKLQKLPFILECHSISEIYLQHNLIQTIDRCFRNLVNIQVLFLNANQLTDLQSVATELSHLKYLRNLNLFDNPLSLERAYKNYIIHKCPSLVIFDRNTITESDRKRSFRIYEAERADLENRHAFMTHINPDRYLFDKNIITNNNYKKKQPSLINARLINSSKAFRPYKSRLRTDSLLINKINNSITDSNSSSNDNTNDYNINKDNNTNLNDPSANFSQHSSNQSFQTNTRSLKEFSYFDWSKVKLHKHNFRIHENSQHNIYHNNDLSLVRTARTSRPNNQNTNNNFEILEHQSNELPQVVTIRFA